MSRRFKQADYAATLEMTVRLGDCLPPEHLARFVVEAIAQMDLSAIDARYGTRGGEAYAPAPRRDPWICCSAVAPSCRAAFSARGAVVCTGGVRHGTVDGQ
jgi:hypothetical protein